MGYKPSKKLGIRIHGNLHLPQVHSLWLAEVEVPHLWLGPGKETSDGDFWGNGGGVDSVDHEKLRNADLTIKIVKHGEQCGFFGPSRVVKTEDLAIKSGEI